MGCQDRRRLPLCTRGAGAPARTAGARARSPSDAGRINLNLREQTAEVLKTLSPREEKIIKMRFGLQDGSEHTLEEVGQHFAVTRERIRQIEAKALNKLKQPSRSRKLLPFVNDSRAFGPAGKALPSLRRA